MTDRTQFEMDRAALRAREDELNRQLRALTDSVLAFRIGAAGSLDVLLRLMSDQSREIIGAHQAVTTVVPDGDWRQSVHAISLSDKYAAWRSYDAKPDGSGIYRVVCDSNRPLRLTQADLEAHPRWRAFGQEAGRHPPIRGLLAAPLIGHDGRNLGLIQLSDKVEGEFTAANEAILVQLAHVTSAVVENVRLYGAAQEANRLKDDFLATLSHELRTPLSAILGWARVLRSGQSDRETTDRALESIERNVRVQTKLIDDLLDISRITSGRLRLQVRPVELGPVILAAIETTRPAAEAKAIRLDTALDPRAGAISGDPERLQQIVWNLVSNAIKFTPTGGRVQVRLERRDPVVEFAVSDTGQGIAPEFLPHVFDRFRQVDSSTARRPRRAGSPRRAPARQSGGATAHRGLLGHPGSIAAPGPGTIVYGGNTACVELRSGHDILVFDAGTGIRELGLALAKEFRGRALTVHLFISHTHWDHIQGLPFFVPAYSPGTTLHIYGSVGQGQSLEGILRGQMQADYFPVSLGELVSSIHVHEYRGEAFRIGEATVTATYLNHPGMALGYRVERGGKAIVYATDHEPYRSTLEVGSRRAEAGKQFGRVLDDAFVAFVKGADLYIGEAQYTDDEYPAKIGWGHSSLSATVEVALQGGVKALALFHHDPMHSDDVVTAMELLAKELIAERGVSLWCFAAREGQTLEI